MSLWFVLLAWMLVNGALVILYRRALLLLWREPVFRHPVLIIESDDWGAGPLSQAGALRRIADVLLRHRDVTGRPPVINLALILAVPDGPAIRAAGSYQRVSLDAPVFADILAALCEGERQGVFSLQLHGHEHYWPETLMASTDQQVRDWLRADAPAVTEELPSHLQSRWTNAAQLPSTPHATDAITVAVTHEVQAYARIVGERPAVVVPPTFVWTREVETAWAAQGLTYVVTPGWRYPRRNAKGLPDGDEGPIANGDRSHALLYLVRSEYFEPARGRDATHALTALDRAVAQRRPCLLENHRDNFINDDAACRHSLDELDKLYQQALARHEGLRFLSSRELGKILLDRDPLWIETRLRGRLSGVSVRLRQSGRFWKLITLTGLAGLLSFLVWVLASVNTSKGASRYVGPDN